METAPTTPDERARLDTLERYAILDTLPEQGFDDVVLLAGQLCGAPVALVSLVARDREWFKARLGLAPREIPLSDSVCAHVLGQADILVIPDLTQDPRTRDGALVTGEPGMRFYAGAPLRTAEGIGLGAVCVLDTVPRPEGLTEAQRTALAALARQVMAQLELRRAVELRDQALAASARVQDEMRLAVEARRGAELRSAALAEVGDRLRELQDPARMDPARMATLAAEIMAGVLGASRAGYGTVDRAREFVVIEPDWCKPGVASVAGVHAFRDYGSFVDDLMRGESVLIEDVATDTRTGAHANALLALGIRALINMPLIEHGALVAVMLVHDDRPRSWSPEEVEFVHAVADRTRAAIAQARSEERQTLLVQELGHRLKNTLTLVQAIAGQTMREAADLGAAYEALSGRLVALGRAHDILMEGRHEGADIRAVLTGAMGLRDDGHERRCRFEGPSFEVGPKAALSISLIVHELATNAAKYGALSVPGGAVAVTWTIDAATSEPVVRLRWEETGGPVVSPPTRAGFGSRLISRGLAGSFGGEAQTTYAPGGVVCTVTAPLEGFQTDL